MRTKTRRRERIYEWAGVKKGLPAYLTSGFRSGSLHPCGNVGGRFLDAFGGMGRLLDLPPK